MTELVFIAALVSMVLLLIGLIASLVVATMVAAAAGSVREATPALVTALVIIGLMIEVALRMMA